MRELWFEVCVASRSCGFMLHTSNGTFFMLHILWTATFSCRRILQTAHFSCNTHLASKSSKYHFWHYFQKIISNYRRWCFMHFFKEDYWIVLWRNFGWLESLSTKELWLWQVPIVFLLLCTAPEMEKEAKSRAGLAEAAELIIAIFKSASTVFRPPFWAFV